MKFVIYTTGWFIILFWMNRPVFSQLRDTVNLEEVVVTGEMKPVLVDRSLYQIKSISAREIRGRGATNLSELLSNELSFKVSQDAALGSSLRLNGLSGEHVKILLDGIPVVGRQGGILDLSQINLFKVDHIEVVEGPMSVIYGSNALGGVINIITQKPVYGIKNIYKLRTYYETAGVYNGDADVTINREKHTFNLNAGRHFFGGFSAPGDSFRYQTWKPKLQWNGSLDYAFRTEKYKLNIGTSLFSEELRNKSNPGDIPNRAFNEYHYTTRNISRIDFSAPVFSNWNTTFVTSYSYYRKRKLTNVMDLVTLDEFPATDPNSQDTTTFGNFMGRWILGGKLVDKLELQSGVEYNQEDGTGKRIGGDRSISEVAGFSSVKYFFLKSLSTQAGIRYIYNSRFSAPLIYNFNAMLDINSNAKLRVSFGKGFRAPSLKELYFEFVDINHNVLGNDSLISEKSLYLGMNGDYIVNKYFDVHLNVFHNIIDNKIDLLYDSKDPSKARYYNLSGKKTTIRGLKLYFNLYNGNKLRVQGGGQLNGQSKIESDDYNWSTDASVSSSYNLEKIKSKISLYYKYNGKYIYYTGEYNETGSLAAVRENFLDKYHSMDLILTKWLWDEKAEISTGVKNIFDNTNILGRGSSGVHSGGDGPGNNPVGWGRTLFVQMQFNLSHEREISPE